MQYCALYTSPTNFEESKLEATFDDAIQWLFQRVDKFRGYKNAEIVRVNVDQSEDLIFALRQSL